jgi:LPS export ABC transporter protein LptC
MRAGLTLGYFALGVCALMWLLVGCGPSRTRQVLADYEAQRASLPVSEWHNVLYTYTDSARKKAVLKAPHIFERLDTALATTGAKRVTVRYMDRGFALTFFDAAADTESTITARSGELRETTGKAIARGDVVVTSRKGERLQTEELTWIRQKDKIVTDKPVTITTATEVLYGVGLESNTRFTQYTIFQLKGIVQLTDGPANGPLEAASPAAVAPAPRRP